MSSAAGKYNTISSNERMSWYELSNTFDHFDEGTIVNFFDRGYDFKSVQVKLF